MSTRTSITFIEVGPVVVHLYREMHDGAVHLEIERDDIHSGVSIVIPDTLVDGLTDVLRRAEKEPARP